MTTALASGPRRSVFAGLDICREASFALPDGTHRPVFEDDWFGKPITAVKSHRSRSGSTWQSTPRWSPLSTTSSNTRE